MKLSTKLAIVGNAAVLATLVTISTTELSAQHKIDLPSTGLTSSLRPKLRDSSKEISCLATNIYFEARSQTREGQVAVAQVTLNRSQHSNWPTSVCNVVWQPNQFSWTHDGKSDRPANTEAYTDILDIASKVYNGVEPNIVGDSTFYHADYVKPRWAKHKSMTLTDRIGDHLFYTWNGDWN